MQTRHLWQYSTSTTWSSKHSRAQQTHACTRACIPHSRTYAADTHRVSHAHTGW